MWCSNRWSGIRGGAPTLSGVSSNRRATAARMDSRDVGRVPSDTEGGGSGVSGIVRFGSEFAR